MKTNYIIKNLRVFALLFAVTAFVTSCTEKIDIELDEGYTRLIVDGTITTDTTAHTIRLSHTTSYYYSEPAPGVSGATVTLSDGETEITLSETEPGIYQTPVDYFGIPGRTYSLNITLASPINGVDTYNASSYMFHGEKLDSIKAAYHDDWGTEGFYEVQCYVLDPPSTDFYQFKIYKNDELITDTLSKVMITDDRFYNGNYTNGIGIGFLDQSKPREKVLSGDRLSIQTSRITEEYFTFITELQLQSGYQTPLFSGPPANIKGNINNGAVGFFATYPVSYAHTLVSEN
jgi:hypothetical protein